MSLKSLIESYFVKARLMQIATANKNQPWAASVYFAFDSHLNLYWISTSKRRHSIELRKNNKVAGTIVLPHTPGDKVRGIQFEGKADALLGVKGKTGLSLYAKRYGMKPERVAAILSGKDGHVCYKVEPSLIVLFDEVNYPKNPRQEYRVKR